ncbi:MAG: hypothetical protein K5707_08280 [Clostridia bacterium]|nr:hypothetical protein [Clostridia bacterium]
MRLIDADALEVLTHWECFSDFDNDYEYVMKTDIDNAPTIEERKTGRWIETKVWGGRNFFCSECRHEFTVDTCMMKPIWNYCPNCGSRMDLEEDECQIEEVKDGKL